MLDIHNSVLAVIDVQGNLAYLMHKKDDFFHHAKIMVKGAELLDIPTLWLEQLPDKLGETIPQIVIPLQQQGYSPIAKDTLCSVCLSKYQLP